MAKDSIGGAGYRGQRLGLPAQGAGSVAGLGSRFVAVAIDWLVGNLIATALAGPGVYDLGSGLRWVPLAAWAAVTALSLAAASATPGQWILGIRVVRLDRRRIGLWSALLRTVLIALVIPPLVVNREGRGWHDLAVDTVVVRAR